ncbi:MAG TPA: hypothetical protein VGQ83_17515 [Polyangia bacterium]|jgi:hypothetical protein
MRMTRIPTLLAAVTLLTAAPAGADLPRIINLQGRLADRQLNVLSQTYSMTFKVFEGAATSACHTETQSVVVKNGLFSVRIGDPGGIGAGCTFAQSTAIELSIQNGATLETLSPRLPPDGPGFAASPYAVVAGGLVSPGSSTVRLAGNASGNVPISNGAANPGLHADLLDGVTPYQPAAPQQSYWDVSTGVAAGDIWVAGHHHQANHKHYPATAQCFPVASYVGAPGWDTCYQTCYDTCWNTCCDLGYDKYGTCLSTPYNCSPYSCNPHNCNAYPCNPKPIACDQMPIYSCAGYLQPWPVGSCTYLGTPMFQN